MKISILLVLVLGVILFELSCGQRLPGRRGFRRPQQLRQGRQRQQGRHQRNQGLQRPRSSRQQRPRQRQPKQEPQQGQNLKSSRRYCDFAAHFISDNADFFMDRTDGLFGENWVDANGCESNEFGCCAIDEDCRCFGDVTEMEEELEEPPRCNPLYKNLDPPQFCMTR